MSRNVFALALLVGVVLVGQSLWAQSYDLPNNDNDCPGNCRQVPWLAGSDIWNNGTLPARTNVVTCTGLTEGNGTTDNAPAINSCIAALTTNQVAYIPPGIYYVNGAVTLKSNTSLRGAGSNNCTQGRWLSGSFPGDT